METQADWQICSSIKDAKNLERFLEACFLDFMRALRLFSKQTMQSIVMAIVESVLLGNIEKQLAVKSTYPKG